MPIVTFTSSPTRGLQANVTRRSGCPLRSCAAGNPMADAHFQNGKVVHELAVGPFVAQMREVH